MTAQAQGTWHLAHTPAYTFGGRLADAAYPCGPLILELGTAQKSSTDMQIISGATVSDFEAYIVLLKSEGYTLIDENAMEDNRFVQFEKAGMRVLVSLFANEKRLTVTEDHTPHTAKALSDPRESGRCEFFMYGLNMDPGGHDHRCGPRLDGELNTTGYPNCGMLLAMSCGDGRVIVIDGGWSTQLDKNGAIGALDRFLHRVAGKGEEDKVTIAAWYVTHNHPDHYQGFALLLKSFPDHYRVERIIGNIPATAIYEKMNMAGLTELSALVRAQSPDCREVKLHTGETIILGGVTLEVIYTHEDAADSETGGKRVKDFNDTCTVIKATLGKKNPMMVMILGDVSHVGEEKMTQAYTQRTMHCDIVQQAHHAWNNVPELYRLIAAPVMCFIQAEHGTVKNEKVAAYTAAAKQYSKKFYYNGDVTKTVGFAKLRGRVDEVYRYLDYLQ